MFDERLLCYLQWLTLPGRLPGSRRFLFEQPNGYMSPYVGVGACPGHYGKLQVNVIEVQ